MALNIPGRFYNALATLLLLPEDVKTQVAKVFKETEPTVGASLYDKKLRQISDFPKNEVTEIIQLLLSLYNANELERDSAAVIDNLIIGLKEQGNERLEDVEDEQYEQLKDYLSDLLEAKLLGLSAKALGIMTQHKYIYRAADVFSDIRGVFARSRPDKKPQGAVIIHTLRIRTQVGDDDEDFYIALDIQDVKALQRVLERAVKKHSSLRASIKETDTTYIGLESELNEDAS